MTRERWHQISTIFHAARAQPVTERGAFVAASCGDDTALRGEVESLLAAHAEAGNFGETPVFGAGLALAPISLPAGTRIGSYELGAPLGVGGMGVVYRARDTKLQRDVAVKLILPAAVGDVERVTRFIREAHVLASLNHPNIAQVYGIEETDGTPAIVMELVEGATLADRIARGAIPIAEALNIARQIAEALEAAHDHGIVHRDLTPANIKVRPDGTVKVLDFGLARSAIKPAITIPGLIVGTASYMAPEQAKGFPVDRRADLWAFGCVLFEMLIGRRAFDGDTLPDVLLQVVERQPDWETIPSATPPIVRNLVRRCLEKDPRRRLDSAAVARLDIDAASHGAPEPSTGNAFPWRWLVAGAAVAATLGAVAALSLTPRASAPPPLVSRFALSLPAAQPIAYNFNDREVAVSPSGTYLAYVAGDHAQLMMRALDRLDATPIAGITNVRAPFFSPDGRWVGFFDRLDEGVSWGPTALRSALKKVSIDGGPPIAIASFTGASRGASWAPNDSIVFATSDPSTGLLRVSADGGEPEVLTTVDRAKEEDHYFPSVLPNGRGVLFTIAHETDTTDRQIAVLDLKTRQHKVLIRSGSQAEYVDTGHLIYTNGFALWGVRFDLATLEIVGDPAPLVDQVLTLGAAAFALSGNGTLVYVPSSAGIPRSLVWETRDGVEEPIAAPQRGYVRARVSPDGHRAALQISDISSPTNLGTRFSQIWTWDFSTSQLTRLTFDPPGASNPVWSADGRYIIFGSPRDSTRRTNAYRRAADGTGSDERLLESANAQRPNAVSPDGANLVVEQWMPANGYDFMMVSLQGQPQLRPLLQTPFDERNAAISPDGRWLAYESNESGQMQIYVRPFPNVTGGRYQISSNGGRTPVWSPRGGELFFVSGTSLMAASVSTTSSFTAGNPQRLFDAPNAVFDGRFIGVGTVRNYDVAPDGRRFLIIKQNGAAGDRLDSATRMIVVQNWFEELKNRLP